MCKRAFSLAALVVLMLALTLGASARTKVSGTSHCAKPDPQHVLPVTGMDGHSLAVEQFKCTWTKPMELAGLQSKDGVSTDTNDISGNTGRSRGYHISTMSNGDLMRVSYSGNSTMKDGALVTLKGTWSYIGGTGKLKGVKGKGTFDCKADGDGVTCEIEGDYSLPK